MENHKLPKTVVSISKCDSYARAEVVKSLERVLKPLGGIDAFVKPGDTVLLKINLLRSAHPDKAVTTHPMLLEALVNIVKEVGGIPVIGDSPGGPNTHKQVKKMITATGVAEVCERTGAEFVLFDRDTVRIQSPEGKLYTSFTVGRIVRDADVIVSLPKLKTHGFMKFTGAVKVLFGVIPGLEKAQFHLKVPDRMDFADMLLDIYLAVRPSLSIMDAVIGMEGDGPSGGTPRHIGAILAGTDAVALDFIASKIIGFDPLDVYTNQAAVNRRLISGMDAIEVTGPSLAELSLENFKEPTTGLSDKVPTGLAKFLKNFAVSKPYLALPSACSGCATCKQSCPSGAITINGKQPQFDYNKCIMCYCCEELCPELAVKRKNHWVVNLVKTLIER
ncbi:MAG TPA: DUF362 domain-containing protein [Anaerolineae bacterium]|nr:DUF362 domain-containing protein [Anaerolineae bacterium]